MHALIIEDNALITVQLADELRHLGFVSVDTAESCAEAIERSAKHRPDLIIADHWLTGESGIEAVRQIRRDWQIPVVYVVAIPDLVLAEVPNAIIVQKPFTLRNLRQAITAALGGSAVPRRCSQPNAGFRPTEHLQCYAILGAKPSPEPKAD